MDAEAVLASLPARLLQGLKATAPAGNCSPGNLHSCFYHAGSGLFSEGNWHNAIMGYSLLKISGSTPESRIAAQHLASSLFSLNADAKRCLFRYRTQSPFWEHAQDEGRYYQASDQKRVAAQCSCIFLWSKLLDTPQFAEQYQQLAANFIHVFWNAEKKMWRTTEGEDSYFRAVDSALSLLALLRLNATTKMSELASLITSTRASLLQQFNYSPPFSETRSYIGKQTTPVLWQDLWVFLALSCSDDASHAPDRLKHWRHILEKYKRPDLPHMLCSGATGSVTYVNDVFFYLRCARLVHKNGQLPDDELGAIMNACVKYLSECTTTDLNNLTAPLLFFERQGHNKPALHPATEAIFFSVFDTLDFPPLAC